MEGADNSSKQFWGLALGGKNADEVVNDPLERSFQITKAILNEPLRLQTRDEYASLYLETEEVEVELLRFVLEDGVEKPLAVTLKKGDKITFRVLGIPAPSIHLIGFYLDEKEDGGPVVEPIEGGHSRKLQILLADWNNKMIFKLVENEMQKDVRDKLENERFAKIVELIMKLQGSIETGAEFDHAKFAELMTEIRSEIKLLRKGLGSLIEAVQSDVKNLWKELESIEISRRLEEVKAEMNGNHLKHEASMKKLKQDLEFELDDMREELKKEAI